MTTSATMIADSISPNGHRLCTIQCTLWRPLLAELNTYRDFSRNGASSRARSVKKTLEEVREAPARPSEFRREQRGMSGGEQLTDVQLHMAQDIWQNAAESALIHAEALVSLGVHKSTVNRLIEPFMWHTHVITATNWDNFLEQRLALLEDGTPAADPDMYKLALAVKAALDGSTPTQLDYGQWHMPYIQQRDIILAQRYVDTDMDTSEVLRRVSVARCAGTSYLTQDKKNRDLGDDLRIFGNLRGANPPHWSPFEHVARPVSYRSMVPARRFNLTGWASLRWFLENDIPIY